MPSAPAVRFTSFGYRYPGRDAPALEDVDLEVAAGAFVLVAGPSGGGKSTLCRAIVGLVPHLLGGTTTGRVETLGADVLVVPAHRLAGQVGYVFQNPEDQVVAQRVEHDVAFGPQNLGLPRAEIRDRVDEALRLVGLEHLRQRPIDSLSAGQQQRIAIAGALALQPKLLVLDEPTSLLDPENARRILDLVGDLQRTLGITLIVAEHRLEWCLPHATQVVLVESGRARGGTPQAIFGGAEPLPDYLNLPPVVRIARRQRAWPGAFPLTAEQLVATVRTNALAPFPNQEEGAGPCRAASRDAPVPTDAASSSARWRTGKNLGTPGGEQSVAIPPCEEEISSAGFLPPMEGAEGAGRNNPIVTLDGVDFHYPNGVEALRDVSVAFYRGETVGILGVSGSGKTTLAKHLNGLLRPSRGRVLLAGADSARLPVSQLSRQVGFVFQNPLHQLFADSVRAEVALGPRAAGLAPEAVAARVDEAVARLGVQHLTGRHPLSLSEGERRRVAIAAVLAQQPAALVLDEPTLGQDAVERRRLGALIRALASDDTCIVLITHEVEFAIDVCDRLLIVQGGRIVAAGPSGEIGYDAERLDAAGLVPPQSVEIAGLLAAVGVEVAEPTPAGVAAALEARVGC